MKVSFRRALCAVAGLLAFAGASYAATPMAKPFAPLAPVPAQLDLSQASALSETTPSTSRADFANTATSVRMIATSLMAPDDIIHPV